MFRTANKWHGCSDALHWQGFASDMSWLARAEVAQEDDPPFLAPRSLQSKDSDSLDRWRGLLAVLDVAGVPDSGWLEEQDLNF